jgi:hypothetical protein
VRGVFTIVRGGGNRGPDSPPPPTGIALSGSVISGLRFQNTGNGNIIDVYAGDDYLVGGDTVAFRGALNQGTYGLNFGLSLNANNTYDGFWTSDRLYVTEANVWAKFLESKIAVKAGFFGDNDYFTPVNAWSLAGGPASNAVLLTIAPIPGLQFDIRAKTIDFPHAAPAPTHTWFDPEDFARNIDFGVRYVNPSFTFFVGFDNGNGPNYQQIDVEAYFGFTAIPKLTLSVESKFQNLTEENGGALTAVAGLQAGYQIADALFARIFIDLGAAAPGFGGPPPATALLTKGTGFTLSTNTEFQYTLNDAIKLFFTIGVQIPNTDDIHLDVFVKPKLAWTLGPFPYAATINFFYTFYYYGEPSASYPVASWYSTNGGKSIANTLSLTFGWTF